MYINRLEFTALTKIQSFVGFCKCIIINKIESYNSDKKIKVGLLKETVGAVFTLKYFLVLHSFKFPYYCVFRVNTGSLSYAKMHSYQ